jgi:hypothetical protein
MPGCEQSNDSHFEKREMTPIPEELLEQVERGNVLLFIGERVARDAAGQAVIDRLTAQLAARSEVTDKSELSFPEAAQACEDEQGRQALVQFVRGRLDTLGHEPQQAHRLIAGLTDCHVLATTCLDRLLDYCVRHGQLEELLEHVRERNSVQYARFRDQLRFRRE